jgi:hypothetical protein
VGLHFHLGLPHFQRLFPAHEQVGALRQRHSAGTLQLVQESRRLLRLRGFELLQQAAQLVAPVLAARVIGRLERVIQVDRRLLRATKYVSNPIPPRNAVRPNERSRQEERALYSLRAQDWEGQRIVIEIAVIEGEIEACFPQAIRPRGRIQ